MTAFTTVIESLLARGCSVRFRASGGSMHPTIRAGDILILAPIDPTELRKGTVVLARQSGRLVAHRIADVTKCDGGTRVLLRGDALSACAPAVSADAVLATVVGIERAGCPIAVDPAAARMACLARRCASLGKYWARSTVRATVLLARICGERVLQKNIESY